MSDLAFMSPQKRESYRQYEDQRRLRLARAIASVSYMGSGLVASVLTIYLLFHLKPVDTFLLVLTVACWLVTTCNVLGLVAARNGYTNLTAAFICGAVVLSIAIVVGDTVVTTGLDALSLVLLFALSIAIALSGVMGNTALLLVVSIVSLLGGSAVLVFNAGAPVLARGMLLILLMFVAVLGTLAAVMVIFQQGFQRTLRELSDVRLAYERASALDDLKNQFIVNVNHELRNPVMAMMGHLDILDMSLATAPPERLQKMTRSAIRASENLRALLASILDASRMEQGLGDFTSEPVALAEALQAAIQLIDPKEGNLQERELRVRLPDGLHIWGEPVRLQQILTNLLSNALKYSAPGTPIEVRARVIIETQPASSRRKRSAPGTRRKMVDITVRDWGLGIPAEQIPLLFQRFVRLPRDLASTVVGNGLGLYMCRVCAEAMGGRIWVESSGVEGEGAAFHLWLPLPPSAAV